MAVTAGTMMIIHGGLLHKGVAREGGALAPMQMVTSASGPHRVVLFATLSPLFSPVPANGYTQIVPVEIDLMFALLCEQSMQPVWVTRAANALVSWLPDVVHGTGSFAYPHRKFANSVTHLKWYARDRAKCKKAAFNVLKLWRAKLLESPSGKAAALQMGFSDSERGMFWEE